MPAGGSDDPGMRGRPQGKVEAIKRQPGGASIGQTEIADDLPFHSLRDPGYRAVIAVRHAAVEFARSETIGDQTGPHELVRRTILSSPRTSLLSVRHHVVFTWACLPGFPRWSEPADFHDRRLVVPESDRGVEAGSAEIDQAPAASDIVLHRVQHLLRVILRTGAGQHALVGLQRGKSLAVKILVG